MPQPLNATLHLTLTLHLTGTLDADMVDDYCIEDITHEEFTGFKDGQPQYSPRVSLLADIDTTQRDVMSLLDNILKLVEAEAIEALREDADDE